MSLTGCLPGPESLWPATGVGGLPGCPRLDSVFGCTDLDGLRTTVPHVLHACGAVSVLDIKKRVGERRRFIEESPSLRALFDAISVLTADDPGATFSPAQVRAVLVALGHYWSRQTVRTTPRPGRRPPGASGRLPSTACLPRTRVATVARRRRGQTMPTATL